LMANRVGGSWVNFNDWNTLYLKKKKSEIG
jgi:hypothetical protein